MASQAPYAFWKCGWGGKPATRVRIPLAPCCPWQIWLWTTHIAKYRVQADSQVARLMPMSMPITGQGRVRVGEPTTPA